MSNEAGASASTPLSHRAALRRLLRFARGHWRLAVVQLLLATLGTSLVVVFPGVVQWFIDDIIPRRDAAAVWQAGGLAAGAFALREFLFYVRTRLSSVFEQRV